MDDALGYFILAIGGFVVVVGIIVFVCWVVLATLLRVFAWIVFYWCFAFGAAAVAGLVTGLVVPLRVLSGRSRTKPEIATPDGVVAQRVITHPPRGFAKHFGWDRAWPEYNPYQARRDAAAVHARARPHVNHAIGGADHVFVVFDHQHAVAQIAQVLERGDEAVVVALVQSDGRLIEHIHHARQATADLRSQANTLRFAARKRFGAALQAQIAQAHVVEKFQAAADFPHHLVRNVRARALQAQRGKPLAQLADAHAGQFGDGDAAVASGAF
mgnify:CR=1 FL=1